jgi:hypothetical protein
MRVGNYTEEQFARKFAQSLATPVGDELSGTFQAKDPALDAFVGLTWTAGAQIGVFTAADTLELRSIGAASATDILDRAAGDGRYALTGSGVLSFNTRTGAVTLTLGDVTGTGLAKGDIGLGSVDNTADAAKNVLSATKLTTARNINGVAFDGTGNITINAVDSTARAPETRTISTTAPLTGGGDLSANRTLAITAASGAAAGSMSAGDKTKLDAISGTNTGDQTSIVGITGTLAQFNTALTGTDFATGGGTVTGASSGTNTGDQTTITGNAGTATTLQTARNFSLNGGGITSVTVAFDGSGNVVLVPVLGAITPTSAAVSGTVSAARVASSTALFQGVDFSGYSGPGVLAYYSAGRAIVEGFNFTGGVQRPMVVAGSSVILAAGGVDIGTVSGTGLDIIAEVRCDTLRIDGTATAAAVAQTHHVPVNINGVVYKMLLAT